MRAWFNSWFDRLPSVVQTVVSVIIFTGFVALVGLICRVIPTRNDELSRPFQTIIGSALADCITTQKQLETAFDNHLASNVKRTGQILLVEVPSGEIPNEFISLTRNLKAKDASSVRILACIETYYEVVGSYTDMSPANRVCQKIWLVDYLTKEILDSNSLCGSSPPQFKFGGGPRYGNYPYGEVREWLEHLPFE